MKRRETEKDTENKTANQQKSDRKRYKGLRKIIKHKKR